MMHRILAYCLAVMVLNIAGCGSKRPVGGASSSGADEVRRLTQNEVVGLANHKAQSKGYDLAKYESPRVEYESKGEGGKWTLLYEGKIKAPGNHFLVWVNDTTRKCTLMSGE